jgi:replicative DNA helicase
MAVTELTVLNAVCKNKDIHVIVADDAELFGAYGDVFEFIRNYYNKHKQVPDWSIVEQKFEDVESTSITAPTAYYADQLRQEFLSSRMQQIMLKASKAMQGESSAKVLDQLQTALSRLNRYATAAQDLNIVDAEAAQEYFDRIRKISEDHGGVPGIATGFDSIDSAYTTGMAPGHFVVVMGYTSRGKSMFADVLAVKAWEQGRKPMIISLEMSPAEQRERIYPIMSSGLFNISDLARGDVSADDFRQWSGKRFEGQSDFIIVSNTGAQSVTPNLVQAKIDIHRPDIVILDYMQLMMDNAKTGAMTPRMLNLSRELKLLGVSNDIPIVAITAVTDEDNDKRDAPPMLSQIAWSSGIEYDANMALAVHRYDNTNLVAITGRKNRNGPLFDFAFEVDFNAGIWNEKFDAS